jgi:phosphatidylinositol alpha-1,6-mannosyltransferase
VPHDDGEPAVTMRRVVVMTPALDGVDGISALTRQVVRSLVGHVGWNNMEVWALDGDRPDEFKAAASIWSAKGSRGRLVGRVMTAAARGCSDVAVIVMHLHLAPLAMLMGTRGARVFDFLIGIEAWAPVRPRERRALERADRLVAISDFTAHGFRRSNPMLASIPIVTCRPGIGEAFPVRMGRDEGFALIVGRLASDERYKGHDELVHVWPAVLKSVPGARLIVAGDGDDRHRIEAAVDAAGLREAISFVGCVDDQGLSDLYSRSSFFVMPSSREGFGLVYLEAMRAGKPCIAAHGSADEILRHEVDGLIIPAGSCVELTEAIVRLFLNPAERKRMGEAARRRMRESFSEEAFAARFLRAVAPSTSSVGQEACP